MSVPPSFLAEAQALFTKGQTEACIDFLVTQLENDGRSFELLDLKRRMHTLQGKIDRGLISNADAQIELNQINNSLLNVLKALKRGAKSMPSASDSNRTPLFVGLGIVGVLAIVAALYFSGVFVGKEIAELDSQAQPESSTEETTPEEATGAAVATIDCGENGMLIDGKCECKPSYGGERCEFRVAPTEHLNHFSDQGYYAIEAVAIPGYSVTVKSMTGDDGRETASYYFTLEESSKLYNGEVHELIRSPQNDYFRIRMGATGDMWWIGESVEEDMRHFSHQFSTKSEEEKFRFVAVGDEGYFSIQSVKYPELYLRAYGKGRQLFFTNNYTDPLTIFQLRKVTIGTY